MIPIITINCSKCNKKIEAPIKITGTIIFICNKCLLKMKKKGKEYKLKVKN